MGRPAQGLMAMQTPCQASQKHQSGNARCVLIRARRVDSCAPCVDSCAPCVDSCLKFSCKTVSRPPVGAYRPSHWSESLHLPRPQLERIAPPPPASTGANRSTPNAANRLRTTMAAVKLSFMWLGVRKTLAPEQRTTAARAFHADRELLSASKRILDTKNPPTVP